jgi:hypothetical protein
MNTTVYFLLGLLVGFLYIDYARKRGRRREHRIYAVGLVMAALVYVGFAVAALDGAWLLVEVAGLVAYTSFAVLGLRHSPWWLALGWAAHPAWDVFLHLSGPVSGIVPAPGIVPAWYAVACISFDTLVAGYIATRIRPPAA